MESFFDGIDFDDIQPINKCVVTWTGKAYGKNRKLIVIRSGPRKGQMFPNPKYKTFKKNICEVFRRTGYQFKGEIDIIMRMTVHARADHHNFIEPVMDAMQESGMIDNDRNVANLILPKPKRHGNKQDDILEITVMKSCLDMDKILERIGK